MATKKDAKPAPDAVDTDTSSITHELKAMTYISNTLCELDKALQERVIGWVINRFDIYIPQ